MKMRAEYYTVERAMNLHCGARTESVDEWPLRICILYIINSTDEAKTSHDLGKFVD